MGMPAVQARHAISGRVCEVDISTTEGAMFGSAKYLGVLLAAIFAAPAVGEARQNGPAASGDPVKPVLTFNSESVLVTLLIKPDKTADFEFVLRRLKEALANSPKPERKAQAAGWHVFKGTQLVQGSAVYIMRIDPVIKGQEYDITRLIAEVFPVEVQELFPKYRDAFAGRAITDLRHLLSMHP
jgi:hypothetical protein